MSKELRVWWNSNFRFPACNFKVGSEEQAILVLKALEKYDLYLGDLITDNSGGLEIFEDGEWSEYYNDEGFGIDEIMEELE